MNWRKIFELQLRIDWSEMDMFSHINNVAYFKYIQAARVNLWEQTGIQDYYNSNGVGPVVASTGCKFYIPLHYPGTVSIKSKIKELGNTSIHLTHLLYNDQQHLAAEAEDVLVMFDYHTKLKTPIPEELKRSILADQSAEH